MITFLFVAVLAILGFLSSPVRMVYWPKASSLNRVLNGSIPSGDQGCRVLPSVCQDRIGSRGHFAIGV